MWSYFILEVLCDVVIVVAIMFPHQRIKVRGERSEPHDLVIIIVIIMIIILIWRYVLLLLY